MKYHYFVKVSTYCSKTGTLHSQHTRYVTTSYQLRSDDDSSETFESYISDSIPEANGRNLLVDCISFLGSFE